MLIICGIYFLCESGGRGVLLGMFEFLLNRQVSLVPLGQGPRTTWMCDFGTHTCDMEFQFLRGDCFTFNFWQMADLLFMAWKLELYFLCGFWYFMHLTHSQFLVSQSFAGFKTPALSPKTCIWFQQPCELFGFEQLHCFQHQGIFLSCFWACLCVCITFCMAFLCIWIWEMSAFVSGSLAIFTGISMTNCSFIFTSCKAGVSQKHTRF